MPYALTPTAAPTPAPLDATPAATRAAAMVVHAFAFAMGCTVRNKPQSTAAIARLIDRKAGIRQAADALRAGITYAERVARLASAVGIESEPPELRQMRAALAELERDA